jgi:hypothetical protein
MPQGGQNRSAAGIAISSRVSSANDPEALQEITFPGLNWEHWYSCPGLVRLQIQTAYVL